MMRRQGGVTLLELLTVCALLLVLLTLALPAVSGWIGRQKLQGALDDVAASLQLARKSATTSQRPVWLALSASADGSWRLRLSYQPTGNACQPASDLRCSSSDEYPGVRLSRLDAPLPLLLQFSPLRGLPQDASGKLLNAELSLQLQRDGCSPANLSLLPSGLVSSGEVVCQ